MGKVSIAFCSLIFRTNPGFMLASVVLVLFISFSLQTRHSPYMSSSQRQLVLAEHSIKAEAGDHTHLRIRNNIEYVKKQVKRKNDAKSNKKAKKDFASVALEDDGNNIEQSELDLKAVAAANEKPHKRNLSFRRHLSEQGL